MTAKSLGILNVNSTALSAVNTNNNNNNKNNNNNSIYKAPKALASHKRVIAYISQWSLSFRFLYATES